MFHPISNDTNIEQCSQGATLLIPAVATGNVPQLTVDLLLSSLPHTLLGSFHSSHVLPAVGGDALATEARRATGKKAKAAAAAAVPVLTTSMQLFFIPTLSLLVMQQRAPAIRGRHRALVAELLSFARSLPGLRQTVLLTSSLAYRKADEELDAVHPVSFYYLPATGESVAAAPVVSASATSAADAAAPAASPIESLLRNTLGWNSLHHNALQQDELPAQFDQLNSAEEVEEGLRVGGSSSSAATFSAAPAPVKPIPVPGLGITRPFFEMVSAAAAASGSASSSSSSASASSSAVASLSFPSLILHQHVNEGANDRDAMVMAQSVYTMLFMQRQQQQPASTQDAKQHLADPRNMIWCPPSSWNLVFGNEAEESLYL